MAKKGTFTIITHGNGNLSLTAASFKKSKFQVYIDPSGPTSINRYRVSWLNAGNFGDSGIIEGPDLPMHLGSMATNSSPFRIGDTYYFQVSVYSVNTKFGNLTRWRKLKPQQARKMEQPSTPNISNKNSHWLIPVLNQTMV